MQVLKLFRPPSRLRRYGGHPSCLCSALAAKDGLPSEARTDSQASEGWRRREGVEPSEDLYDPQTGFEDQRRHRAPSFSREHEWYYSSVAHDLLRELPAVDRLLAHPRTQPLLARFSRKYVTHQCREILDELRREIRQGHAIAADALGEEAILGRLEERLALARDLGLTRVVNATGTILHTNLGRALLPQAAIDAVCRAGASAVNLEYDLDFGERGRREEVIEKLLVDLTGAEAATVVNNNAAAVLLALNTLASGKEVIVSRGELIEIGGAFRIPEIMARSGAILKEVGTTNRTHAADYERAITANTGLLLKVHTSNYKVVGFVADVGLADLVAIGKKHGVPVMEDLGSGALVDLSQYGLPKEPVVAERIALGADLVTFSGDKVLGGP